MPAINRLLRAIANLFGVNLLDVAIDQQEHDQEGTDTYRELTNRDPAATIRALEQAIRDDDHPLEPADMVVLASTVADPRALLTGAVASAGLDDRQRPDQEPPTDELDTLLEQLVDEAGGEPHEHLWRPVDTIETLDDDPNTAYLWILRDGVDPHAFGDQLHEVFNRQLGHDPRGMHLPIASIDELRRADPDFVQRQVAPWLEERDQDPDQEGDHDGHAGVGETIVADGGDDEDENEDDQRGI